jgi:hypothetical protein
LSPDSSIAVQPVPILYGRARAARNAAAITPAAHWQRKKNPEWLCVSHSVSFLAQILDEIKRLSLPSSLRSSRNRVFQVIEDWQGTRGLARVWFQTQLLCDLFLLTVRRLQTAERRAQQLIEQSNSLRDFLRSQTRLSNLAVI